jgi:hypothetical protein
VFVEVRQLPAAIGARAAPAKPCDLHTCQYQHPPGGTASTASDSACRQGLRGSPWHWHPRPSSCRTGYGARRPSRVSGSPGQDAPDAPGMRGRAPGWPAAGRCLETPGRSGAREGCQPGIIQRAGLRQAVRPLNLAVESASAFPVAGAQQEAASQHVRALSCRHVE